MKLNKYYDMADFQCLDNIDHQTNDLYLTRCGIQHCPPSYSWGPKKRPQYHLHVVLDGKGYFEINHNIYHLERGQIFLIPPNTVSRYYSDNTNPWTYAFISFQGNKADLFAKQAGFTASPYIRDCGVTPEEYLELIEKMLDTTQLTITNELYRASYLFSFFALLTSTSRISQEIKSHHDYLPGTYLEHALKYIELNYHQNIHIQDIADYIGITRSYLFHIFNKELKTSPKNYLMNYRIDKAKYFLASTDTFIKDISRNVGYEDPLAFSKIFRNVTGYSPSEYRKYKTDSSKD